MSRETIERKRRMNLRIQAKERVHLRLSERDSLLVLNLLENPPAPNAKLLAAAGSLPTRSRELTREQTQR
jgi:uncharacterized protein (DUF1778 family)